MQTSQTASPWREAPFPRRSAHPIRRTRGGKIRQSHCRILHARRGSEPVRVGSRRAPHGRIDGTPIPPKSADFGRAPQGQ